MQNHIVFQRDFRIGTLLIKNGSISQEQLNFALSIQKQNPHLSVGNILVAHNIATKQQIFLVLWKQRLACFVFIFMGLFVTFLQPCMAKNANQSKVRISTKLHQSKTSADAQEVLQDLHLKRLGIEEKKLEHGSGIQFSKSVNYKKVGAQMGSLLCGMFSANEAPQHIDYDLSNENTMENFNENVKLKLEFSHDPNNNYQLGFGKNTVTASFKIAF